jgi:hypothetical protein
MKEATSGWVNSTLRLDIIDVAADIVPLNISRHLTKVKDTVPAEVVLWYSGCRGRGEAPYCSGCDIGSVCKDYRQCEACSFDISCTQLLVSQRHSEVYRILRPMGIPFDSGDCSLGSPLRIFRC